MVAPLCVATAQRHYESVFGVVHSWTHSADVMTGALTEAVTGASTVALAS